MALTSLNDTPPEPPPLTAAAGRCSRAIGEYAVAAGGDLLGKWGSAM